jgi:hypothetical protein
MSPTVQPDAVAISITTSSLAMLAMTWRTRGSAARAASSMSRRSAILRESSAAMGASVSVYRSWGRPRPLTATVPDVAEPSAMARA